MKDVINALIIKGHKKYHEHHDAMNKKYFCINCYKTIISPYKQSSLQEEPEPEHEHEIPKIELNMPTIPSTHHKCLFG